MECPPRGPRRKNCQGYSALYSHPHLSELMTGMGIVFSMSWQRWWVKYYPYMCSHACWCMLVKKRFEHVTAA